uniref:Uncharacterized protein n=1 Tax=Rhizophora mucronata TaxID=61149 RepID=A0A2P2N9Y5_RHIMU
MTLKMIMVIIKIMVEVKLKDWWMLKRLQSL